MTKPTVEVLGVLLAASEMKTPVWGLRISALADLGSSTVYPILHRLEEAEWVSSQLEQDAHSAPRRFYRLTADGERLANSALDARNHRPQLDPSTR
jgi:DNA-binding PadR family transcriptional regulator